MRILFSLPPHRRRLEAKDDQMIVATAGLLAPSFKVTPPSQMISSGEWRNHAGYSCGGSRGIGP